MVRTWKYVALTAERLQLNHYQYLGHEPPSSSVLQVRRSSTLDSDTPFTIDGDNECNGAKPLDVERLHSGYRGRFFTGPNI